MTECGLLLNLKDMFAVNTEIRPNGNDAESVISSDNLCSKIYIAEFFSF